MTPEVLNSGESLKTGYPSPDTTTKVLIVDDHSLVCETMAIALTSGSAITLEIVDCVDSASDLINARGRFDVVLLDYEVPGMDGLEGLKRLIEANNGSVALFSGVASHTIVERALEIGASGFIPKTLPLKTLKHAINFIADGETFIPADFIRRAGQTREDQLGLKPRELRVLALLCEGLPNKEIGRETGADEGLVKLDVKSICRKLGARNRTQAVLEAKRRGLC